MAKIVIKKTGWVPKGESLRATLKKSNSMWESIIKSCVRKSMYKTKGDAIFFEGNAVKEAIKRTITITIESEDK